MERKRNAEEIAKLLDGYRASGMTRVKYCRQTVITTHTLDYYRRRQGAGQRLVRVKSGDGAGTGQRIRIGAA